MISEIEKEKIDREVQAAVNLNMQTFFANIADVKAIKLQQEKAAAEHAYAESIIEAIQIVGKTDMLKDALEGRLSLSMCRNDVNRLYNVPPMCGNGDSYTYDEFGNRVNLPYNIMEDDCFYPEGYDEMLLERHIARLQYTGDVSISPNGTEIIVAYRFPEEE